jgi:Transposase DDE domain group 1
LITCAYRLIHPDAECPLWGQARLPEAVAQWSLTSLREKLIKIGAKVVRHARYAVFQMAEVAVPRELFEQILRLIDGLRPRPAPA